MRRVIMRHGANDGEPVGHLGEPRKMLADPEPGRPGLYCLEGSAYFGRGIGLWVPRIELTWTAPHEDQNARSSTTQTRI